MAEAPILPLAAFVAATAGQRMYELALSARNARRLAARGAVEHGRGHFPFLVLVHVAFLVATPLEVLVLGARPGPAWPLWLGLWTGAHLLRIASIVALGDRWSTRIWVIPGAPLVRHGPYRFLRHPNYVAVVVELIAGPMMFGAWRTAVAITALNAVPLALRIRAENRALEAAAAVPRATSAATGND
jgi:methyltransferase